MYRCRNCGYTQEDPMEACPNCGSSKVVPVDETAATVTKKAKAKKTE